MASAEQFEQASTDPPRKLWMRPEVLALDQSGVVNLQSFELIEGGLVAKTRRNRRHSIAIQKITRVPYQVFGLDRVSTESAIEVAPDDEPTSLPEPGVTVYNRNDQELVDLPGAADILLVVEVSHDLRAKAGLYARAGITEYWVADVNKGRLTVHREPVDGRYASIVSYEASESVTPLAAPASEIPVANLFPRP